MGMKAMTETERWRALAEAWERACHDYRAQSALADEVESYEYAVQLATAFREQPTTCIDCRQNEARYGPRCGLCDIAWVKSLPVTVTPDWARRPKGFGDGGVVGYGGYGDGYGDGYGGSGDGDGSSFGRMSNDP